MALTGHGLDFDLCSSKAKIKESISCYFMAARMMNGAVSRPNEAAVSLPRILIVKVASHCSGFHSEKGLLLSLSLSLHCSGDASLNEN